MMGHNQIGWVMPEGFEEYVNHYNAAKNAWLGLYVALNQLRQATALAYQSPTVLVQPSNQPWPTQDQLKAMYGAAEQLSIPLMGEYNRLPSAVKSLAPQPGTEKTKPT